MAKNYYAQSDHVAPTMTVGKLIEALQKHDPNAPVVFRSPLYGAFGSNTAYSLEAVTHEVLPAKAVHHPACMTVDEETGEPVEVEAWTQNWHRWEGVVIG